MKMDFNSCVLVLMNMFLSYIGHAHDVDKAYFKIEQKQENVIVYSEFPWSISNVLKESKYSNLDLQNRYFNYLKDNITLRNKKEEELPLLAIERLFKNDEEHHSMISYKMIFKGNDLHKITNLTMCEYYNNQMNYHTLYNQSNFIITTSQNPTFFFSEQELPQKLDLFLVAQIVLVILLIILVIKKRNLISSKRIEL